MVCDEADRFMGQIPPAQVKDDTKAEENAWNAKVISLAFNMFPKHPHHAKWGITAERWNASSFLREADIKANRIIDGYPIEHAVKGATSTTTTRWKITTACIRITCRVLGSVDTSGSVTNGRETIRPKALTVNAEGVYGTLKKLAFPDGGFIYPNGQDWQLHRQADWVSIHARRRRLQRPSGRRADAHLARRDGKDGRADPKSTIVSPHSSCGPRRKVSSSKTVAKMRAAANFSRVRIYVDRRPRNSTFKRSRRIVAGVGRQVGNRGRFDVPVAGRGLTASRPLATAPPHTQGTIGQAEKCKDDDGNYIDNTACIIFNSRGVPVDSTYSPTGNDALYITTALGVRRDGRFNRHAALVEDSADATTPVWTLH